MTQNIELITMKRQAVATAVVPATIALLSVNSSGGVTEAIISVVSLALSTPPLVSSSASPLLVPP